MSEVQNEVGEKAASAICHGYGSMRPESNDNRKKRYVISIATRSLAACLALSFLATLLPAGAVVAQSIMACCRGKSANHCHSGIKSKKTTSVSNQCHSDCCARCAPAQQTKRERTTAASIAKLVSPTVVHSHVVNITFVAPTHEEWASITPRGPPAFLL
jgi:hypothetical protein